MSPSARTDRRVLYDGRDVTQLAVRAGAGLVLIAVGWYQASQRLLLDDQRPWLALAAGGLTVGCVSGALWILQLRRAVSLRAADLRRDAARLVAHEMNARSLSEVVNDLLVAPATDGALFFHRVGCDLVAGRDTVTATERQHHRAGRVACEACLVPQPTATAELTDASA